ncbi:MAG TPA: ATP-binding cassette domain-containing protein [Acidobacteriaceae bacterium]|nr:ATP-binding cassette domain-containing protein [Acidobacteriaceae bacterium]
MALLEVLDLTKDYPRSGVPGAGTSGINRVVDGVSFTIRRGETLGLVGESGSGKSTVARMVLGLIPPSSGEVRFDGQSVTAASPAALRKLRRRFQPVFQDPFAALNPRMTVAAILAEPFKIHLPGLPASARQEQVRALLAAVGLDESSLPRFPHEFSGGQRQRINIARALALRPELLVLDEPVSALDVSVGAQIVNLLRQLQQDFQLTYLFISHSMPLVRYLATGIAVLRRGRLVESGECEEVCRAPQDPYTQALLRATPELPEGLTELNN